MQCQTVLFRLLNPKEREITLRTASNKLSWLKLRVEREEEGNARGWEERPCFKTGNDSYATLDLTCANWQMQINDYHFIPPHQPHVWITKTLT